jgi:hypothetical protein
MPQVWGVVVDDAAGSSTPADINSGIWILRRTD